MNGDLRSEDYVERLVELSEQLRHAFPDYRCLRCGSDAFLLRLIVGDDEETFAETVETTCKLCGMVELHRVKLLNDSISAGHLPRGVDGQ